MKKRNVIILVCILMLVLPYLLIHRTNDLIARAFEKELLSCPLPPATQIIESTSVAGKMIGNGNGMQWFGILLVKSDLDETQLSEWYHQAMDRDGSATIDVFKQDSPYVFAYDSILFRNSTVFDSCYQIRLADGMAAGAEPSFLHSLLNIDLRGH